MLSTRFECELRFQSGSDLAFLPGSEPLGSWRCVVASMKETSGVQEDLGRPQVRVRQQGPDQLPGQHLLTDYFCRVLAGFLVGHKRMSSATSKRAASFLWILF